MIVGFAFVGFLIIASVTHIQIIDGSVRRFRCGILTDCLGKSGTNFILSTLANVTHVDCAIKCEEMYQCMLFFHNSMNQSCTLHSRTLTDTLMIPDINSRCFMSEYTIESWVVEVLLSTGQSSTREPVSNIIGPPDRLVWERKKPEPTEFLEVRFSGEMYIEQIHIYQWHDRDGVIGIYLLAPDGIWELVWNHDQPDTDISSVAFRRWSKQLTMTDFKTSTVRIITGLRSHGHHEVMDAISICGKTHRYTHRKNTP